MFTDKGSGALIINADDWGRDRATTNAALECVLRGTVSSVSAMVFMEDSERAAAIAGEHGVDTGLHLNLTAQFTANKCSDTARSHLERVARYLRSHPFARALYNPTLASAFEYLVAAQCDEYERLYGVPVQRVDGHHHMHLAANVLLQGLLPAGAIVRPHFSHERGEKFRNLLFRKATDIALSKRRRVDLLYSLPPMDFAKRLEKIFFSALHSAVELETHPIHPEEFQFLMGEEMLRKAEASEISVGFNEVAA